MHLCSHSPAPAFPDGGQGGYVFNAEGAEYTVGEGERQYVIARARSTRSNLFTSANHMPERISLAGAGDCFALRCSARNDKRGVALSQPFPF